MDGSWLEEDHQDFLEELKMEILEEQKKEGIIQTAGCVKRVSVTIFAKSSLAPTLDVKTGIKGLCLFLICSLKDMRMPQQVQIQQHVPLPFWRRTVA